MEKSQAYDALKGFHTIAASVFHYRILSIRDVKEYLRDKGLQVNL